MWIDTGETSFVTVAYGGDWLPLGPHLYIVFLYRSKQALSGQICCERPIVKVDEL